MVKCRLVSPSFLILNNLVYPSVETTNLMHLIFKPNKPVPLLPPDEDTTAPEQTLMSEQPQEEATVQLYNTIKVFI